ncbi:periplasmic heavy metal sensor [uncultured Hyphomonas sp.]|uniref:periplasmic heavy metal sensor n=1 Tax=uncultured Hyphomonas sp. TaxID=225298 RepID=UPI002AAB79EE|nr:periplasmic heavy metal sensor [uncultured Hyphomonas sp.]
MSDTSDTPRRWPFWLIVSLMANMILVGLLAGFLVQAGPKGKPDGPPRERITWGDRDDPNRDAIRQVFKEAFKASGEERMARVESRRQLAEAVLADPYNPDAVREAFSNLRSADDAVNEATHEAMVDLFASMTMEQRQHMAEILRRGPRDHKSKGKMAPGERGGPGDGPPPPPPPPEMEP